MNYKIVPHANASTKFKKNLHSTVLLVIFVTSNMHRNYSQTFVLTSSQQLWKFELGFLPKSITYTSHHDRHNSGPTCRHEAKPPTKYTEGNRKTTVLKHAKQICDNISHNGIHSTIHTAGGAWAVGAACGCEGAGACMANAACWCGNCSGSNRDDPALLFTGARGTFVGSDGGCWSCCVLSSDGCADSSLATALFNAQQTTSCILFISKTFHTKTLLSCFIQCYYLQLLFNRSIFRDYSRLSLVPTGLPKKNV